MPAPEQSRLPYVAALDGIRAIAILAVLVFHVHSPALRGGFTGVDVFFVLSGFLLTSLIAHDLRAGCFSFREFYLRRAQRILPNAIVTILAVLLLWALFLPPNASVQPAVHGLWTLSNLSNFYIWKNLGAYWGEVAESAPLTHFWSLGVEEQFYLLFPGALLLLVRYHSDRLRLWLGVATVASFALGLVATKTHPTTAFYLLPTRVWELLLGAIVALSAAPGRLPAAQPWFRWGPATRGTLGWLGLGAIFVGYVGIGANTPYPGIAALLPAGGTALILVAIADGQTRVSRLLAAPFLVQTGKLSYSLYLWHWPLIIFGKIQAEFHGMPPLAGAVGGAVAGIGLSVVSYVGVERPLRQRGPGRTGRLAIIAAGFAIAVLACGLLATRRVAPDPGQRFDPPKFLGLQFDARRVTAAGEATIALRYADTYFPPLPPPAPNAWRTGGIVRLHGGGQPRVVVLGSSHALMYARLIDDLCRELGIPVAFLCADEGAPAFFETTVNPNFPTTAEAREFDETRKQWLRTWRPSAVLAIDRWDTWVGQREGFDAKLRRFLDEVSPLAGRILFVTQVPVVTAGLDVNLRGLVSWRMGADSRLPRLWPDTDEPRRHQAAIAAEAATAAYPNLRVLRADRTFYREDGSVRYAEGRTFFYADDNHLSDAGSELVRDLFRQAILEALAATRSP